MPNAEKMLHFDYYAPMAFNLVRILVILVVAFILTRLGGRLLRSLRDHIVKMMIKSGDGSDYEVEKRVKTISGVVKKALVLLIWAIAGIMILDELHFRIYPLVAGAGVIGVAVGFGAQNIIRDILSGLFILMENQLRVYDVAIINGKGGLVEEINLRTTVLRDEDGTVHIIPNGAIQGISNLTRQYSYYLFNLSVNYNQDPDRAIAVLKEIADRLQAEETYGAVILAPLEVMGVDKLADAGMIIKARFKTLPGKQWLIGREMNRRIKKQFEEAHVEMPFTEQTVHLVPELTPELRGEIKELVREAMKQA